MRAIAQPILAALCGLGLMVSNAHATPRIDCPLRDQPYSIDTPVIDIMLKPEAAAVLGQFTSASTQPIPPQFSATTAPSFAAIMTPRTLAGFGAMRTEALPDVDAALRALPITAADRAARCARYDIERPQVAIPSGRPRILLFEKINGFRDGPSVEAAHAAFLDMAARNHWGIVAATSGAAISPAILRHFDLVIWNNISGDVLTMRQRRAFQRYMERGGGFVGVHGAAGDPVYFWDWYVDTLIGARFIGHTGSPQFQDARVVIAESPSGVGRGLAPGWTMNDEWYSFRASPRGNGAAVIASLDETSYSPVGFRGQDVRMGADHPIAWTRCVGAGRAFYSAIGHRPETYSDPHHVTLLEQAIAWAAGGGETVCRNGQEVPRGGATP